MIYLKKYKLFEYHPDDVDESFDFVQNNNSIKLKEYLDSGGNPNRVAFDGWTLLMYAKNYEIAKLLIDNGADVNFIPDSTISPLFIFVKNDYPNDVVKLLIENGADVNNEIDIKFSEKNHSILTDTINNGTDNSYKNLVTLIESGVDLTIRNYQNQTIFEFLEDENKLSHNQFVNQKKYFKQLIEEFPEEYGKYLIDKQTKKFKI